jgi:hypothetical protein
MHNIADISEPAWYRQFWPWFLIALPSVAVVACFISLSIAMRHSDSSVRDDYSKQGFAIQPSRAAANEAARLHLTAALIIAADGRIDLDLRGESMPIPPTLNLEFIHPLDRQHDIAVVLNGDTKGHFQGYIPNALKGRWLIELQQPGQHWQLRTTIDRQPQRDLQVAL